MCFSATASFVTAGTTAIIGVVALTRANGPRELPLAATPILFALQQGIEGLLWLDLPVAPDGPLSTGLTLLYLFFAEVFWPIFVPIAVLLVEPKGRRRQWMAGCLAIGVGVGGYLQGWILTHSHGAVILGDHIVYVTGYKATVLMSFSYLAATGLPPILSSQRTVVVLGTIILLGSVIAYAFYWEAFVSVWCFFAAAASTVVLGHFELLYRRRLRIAGA
jgi:hypothetical protein